MIDSFDTNKDGQFDRNEVRSMVLYMLQERKKVQSMKLIVWVILACVVGGAFTVLAMCSAANEISKETHADPGGVMVDLSGSAVQTDAVRSMADMRGFLDLPFATMEKLDYLVFATGEDGCSGDTEEHLMKVSRVVRSNTVAGGGAAASMKVYGSDGSSVVDIDRDGVLFGSTAVCLGAEDVEEDGVERRRFLEMETEHRRRLGFGGSLMTSGSFTMMASSVD